MRNDSSCSNPLPHRLLAKGPAKRIPYVSIYFVHPFEVFTAPSTSSTLLQHSECGNGHFQNSRQSLDQIGLISGSTSASAAWTILLIVQTKTGPSRPEDEMRKWKVLTVRASREILCDLFFSSLLASFSGLEPSQSNSLNTHLQLPHHQDQPVQENPMETVLWNT